MDQAEKRPKVAVVIPTMQKNKEYLRTCVESLRYSGVDWDIIVISNGGDWYPLNDISGITNRFHTRDQGQCQAVNMGVRQINPNHDWVFICNDDMYFAPGWNKNLRFDYPVFSPNLLEPTDNPGSAPPFLKVEGGYTLDSFQKDIVDEAVDQHVNTKMKTKEETGFNFPLFIRKDIWERVKGYDEAYDPWGSNSDSDLQARLHIGGLQPMRLRDVLVYHFSNKSGTFDGSHQAEWQHNWDYFVRKFGYDRTDSPDVWYSVNIVDEEKNIFHPDYEGQLK